MIQESSTSRSLEKEKQRLADLTGKYAPTELFHVEQALIHHSELIGCDHYQHQNEKDDSNVFLCYINPEYKLRNVNINANQNNPKQNHKSYNCCILRNKQRKNRKRNDKSRIEEFSEQDPALCACRCLACGASHLEHTILCPVMCYHLKENVLTLQANYIKGVNANFFVHFPYCVCPFDV